MKCILHPTVSIKIRNAKCTSDFGQCRRQFVADVAAKISATSMLLSHQNEKFAIWFNLAFLQFFRLLKPEIALSPYFFGLAQFDRIIELGEQTGAQEEFFKIFLKMVPIYPRFFSY